MKLSNPGILILAGLLVLTGCQSGVMYTAQDTTVLTPKPSRYEVAVAYQVPNRPHRVLGEVSVTREIKPSFGQTGAFDMAVEEMKTQARKVGGDAVVDVHALDGSKSSGSGRLTLIGKVIVYTAPAPLSADTE